MLHSLFHAGKILDAYPLAVLLLPAGNALNSDPPDMALCTDGNVLVQAVNTVISVFSVATGAVLAGPMSLSEFLGECWHLGLCCSEGGGPYLLSGTPVFCTAQLSL